MSDMKCPFCQQELVKDGDGYYTCYTDNCAVMSAGGNGASGSASVWFEREPKTGGYREVWNIIHDPTSDCSALDAFDIAPYDGDWKDSLMECGK